MSLPHILRKAPPSDVTLKNSVEAAARARARRLGHTPSAQHHCAQRTNTSRTLYPLHQHSYNHTGEQQGENASLAQSASPSRSTNIYIYLKKKTLLLMIVIAGGAARCLHPIRICRPVMKEQPPTLTLSPLRTGPFTRAHTIIATSVNLSSFKLNKCFTALWVCRNLCCQGDCSCNSYSELFTLISPTALVVLWAPECQIMMLMESLL